MSKRNYTRANDFDRIVGKYQTLNSIMYGTGKSLLDVGCGIGEYTPMFLKAFERVVGLDPSKECLAEAKKARTGVEYVRGYGETFRLNEKFDTISLNNILEHVDDPILLLENCKNHLNEGGRIIVQVPNAQSITRRLGALMFLIPYLYYISDKEKKFWGHKRAYTLDLLVRDCRMAGLEVLDWGGLLWKPLPNDDLWKIYKREGTRLVEALIRFGKDRPNECACIYAVCQ